MHDMRRHKRYSVDLVEVQGKMSLADKVEVLDISLGGISLKADRRLNPGKEYFIKLREQGKSLDVTGIVVRSELVGTEENSSGEVVSIYTAGMRFKDGSMDKIADFLQPIEQKRLLDEPFADDRRLHVRFDIMTAREQVLSFPAQFMVKSISLGGMLIKTDQALEVQSRIPMGLALNTENPVNFIGRAVACRAVDNDGQTFYEIGVEFIDLSEQGRSMVSTFIDYLATRQIDEGSTAQSGLRDQSLSI